MKSWFRLVVSFFVLVLIILSFAYLFGPPSMRQEMRNPASTGAGAGEARAVDTTKSRRVPNQDPGHK